MRIDWNALEQANEPLNAFIDWDRAADAGQGVLAGVTIGVKANVAVKGLPWSAGMEAFRSRIAERDADTVHSLRAAGAIILGTLNMDEAAYGTEGNNPWFGPVHNPHRQGYSAGGSSSGSGAAVAAGMCDAALGTDTMGSVRIPAAMCGIYGFKPANSRVNLDGLELCGPTLDVIGPLARSLDMLERIARVMTDFGEGEGIAAAPATLAGLGGISCAPDVMRVYETAKAVMDSKAEFALLYGVARILTAGFIYCAKPTAIAFADLDQSMLSDHLKTLIAYGPSRIEDEWAEDQVVYKATAREMRAAVDMHGLILMPTTPCASASIGAKGPTLADFCSLANIAGLPAINVPAGWSDEGMPIGMQLIGRAGEEKKLFSAARKLDAALNAYRAPANTYGGPCI